MKQSTENPADAGIRGFATGFISILRGAVLILKTPRLLAWAAVPAIISVLIFAVLAMVGFFYGDDLVKLFWQGEFATDRWYHVLLVGLHWLVELAVRLLLVFVSAVLAFFMSMIVVEPFIDILSEITEEQMGKAPPEAPFTPGKVCRELLLAVKDVSVDVSLFLLYQGACLLLLLLIPVIGGPACVAAQGLGAAFFAGVEMMSGPLGRRGIHGRRRWSELVQTKALVLGVGTGALLLALVPLAQLFTLPIAVVGGTIAVVDSSS